MKILSNEGYVGIMILKDGTQKSFVVRRVTKNLSKLIFYTEKGMQEITNANKTNEEKSKADELKKLNEKALMRMGYIDQIPLSNIQFLK